MSKKTASDERQDPEPAPQYELIVRRGALRRYDQLKQKTANLPVRLSWDRRLSERRSAAQNVEREHRRTERRADPSVTWEAADFVVVENPPSPSTPAKKAKRRV